MGKDKPKFLRHESCSCCGSSDARAIYDDGSEYCFSCEDYKLADDSTGTVNKQKEKEEKVEDTRYDLYYNGEYAPLHKRKINLETAKFYRVKTDKKGNYIYPIFDKNNELVATKIRKGGEKAFAITGELRKTQLFGQQLFGTGGKYLTIVEGQDDALAAYQMLGSKWPVISVHTASSAVKDVLYNLDYIETFEKIVLVFDSDEAGKKAALEVAEKITPGKVLIVTLNRYKDANDYLANGSTEKFQQEWWQGKLYTPADVLSMEDSFEFIQKRVLAQRIPLPSTLANVASMLEDLVAGEITVIGALTSIGKTTFVNNILAGFLEETDLRIGYVGLETTVAETAISTLKLLEPGLDKNNLQMLQQAFEKHKDKLAKLKVLDHVGSLGTEELLKKIRNMIVAWDLPVFIIDPIQSALPDLDNDTVKGFMDGLQKISNQTSVSFICVSHMRKPSEKNPHNVSEYDLLGSSVINQVAYNTILLSRDKTHKSSLVRRSTKVLVVKARRSGNTGEAGWLEYIADTGRLVEGFDPYPLEDEDLLSEAYNGNA